MSKTLFLFVVLSFLLAITFWITIGFWASLPWFIAAGINITIIIIEKRGEKKSL